MTRNRFAAALIPALMLPAAFLAWSPRMTAQENPDPGEQMDDQDQELGENPERYAQVKVVEGDVTIRKGDSDEALSRGIPVAEGDVVESNGRGVLQLGDGSTVAFGARTKFKVAALFSDQDEVRRVLLVLERGELRIRKGNQSDAIFRVDTPSGFATLGNRGNATTRPEATIVSSTDLKGNKSVFMVHASQASFANNQGQTQVFAGQRLTVYGNDDTLDRVADFNTYSLTDFDQWAGDIMRPRPSESASRVPQEIRYYADDLDSNGKWVYVDDCATWCWAPTVAVDWRPYTEGHWGAFGGGMTWVSSEPWGYVTYHHGRWGWGAGLGWYWIPGVNYSPAWVAWNTRDSYFGWAPLGYYNRPCHWGYGAWGGGISWNVVDVRYVNARDMRNHYYHDRDFFHTFNSPGQGRRPWNSGRLIVNRAEFRDPEQFRRVAFEPRIARERRGAYTAVAVSTGRMVARPQGEDRRPLNQGFNRVERPETAQHPVRSIFQRPSEAPDRRIQRNPGEGRPQVTRTPDMPERRIQRTPSDERPRIEPREIPRRDEPRHEAPRMERPETPRREPNRVEPRETPRQEAPRHEAPRQEAPRQEAPRREAPREAPRMERRDPPRQESRPSPQRQEPRVEKDKK